MVSFSFRTQHELHMLAKIRNLILDMDGVLWRGDTAMPGLANFFDTLRQLDIGFILATNNATKTAEQYTHKLANMGVIIPANQILTSAATTAYYIANKYPAGIAVYVIGTTSLHETLQAKGFHIVGPNQVEEGATARLVVVGFTPFVVYKELAMGSLLVHNGASLIGTNPDPTIPSEIGPLPGAGALLAVISAATGVEPYIVGKPGPAIFEEAIRRLASSKDDTAMVGDRLSTDIAGAKSAGLSTILLLSGISSRKDILESGIKPDYVFSDISELTHKLQSQDGK
jgi:4-nitrophenyl phosphatase